MCVKYSIRVCPTSILLLLSGVVYVSSFGLLKCTVVNYVVYTIQILKQQY